MNGIDPCQSAIAASAIAAAIAEGQDDADLAVLAALFTLVGDALVYIVSLRERCESQCARDVGNGGESDGVSGDAGTANLA